MAHPTYPADAEEEELWADISLLLLPLQFVFSMHFAAEGEDRNDGTEDGGSTPDQECSCGWDVSLGSEPDILRDEEVVEEEQGCWSDRGRSKPDTAEEPEHVVNSLGDEVAD